MTTASFISDIYIILVFFRFFKQRTQPCNIITASESAGFVKPIVKIRLNSLWAMFFQHLVILTACILKGFCSRIAVSETVRRKHEGTRILDGINSAYNGKRFFPSLVSA